MMNNESLLDIATLLVLAASVLAGLAAGLVLRLFFPVKAASNRFGASLFFLFLSACVAASSTAFILLYRSGAVLSGLLAYCISGFICGALSALFPRSIGSSAICISASLVIISFVATAPMTRLKPGLPAARLYVQDIRQGSVALLFTDDSGSVSRELDASSLEIEAETLRVVGPLGILTGRRHYRFVTFREHSVDARHDRPLPRFLLRLLGFSAGASSTGSLQLRYLSSYELRFDSAMNLQAHAR